MVLSKLDLTKIPRVSLVPHTYNLTILFASLQEPVVTASLCLYRLNMLSHFFVAALYSSSVSGQIVH
jgi:hypothetical protein